MYLNGANGIRSNVWLTNSNAPQIVTRLHMNSMVMNASNISEKPLITLKGVYSIYAGQFQKYTVKRSLFHENSWIDSVETVFKST